jgi:hypothetical protein
VKDFPCKTKEELRAEEDKYVKPELKNELCLNERSAIWDIEKDKTRQKEWYVKNRERLLQKANDYYHARVLNQ